MFYGGASLLEAAGDFASTISYAGRWPEQVRRFAEETQPVGHFLKVDWSDRKPDVLTSYARFKKGTATVDRLAEAAVGAGVEWPGSCAHELRDALGVEPFLIALRTANDGLRQVAVYFALRPTLDDLLRKVAPAVAAASGVGTGHLPGIRADLELLYEDASLARFGMEVGIQHTEGRDELRCTFYLREIPGDRACRFVERSGKGDATRVAALAEAVPRKRFLYGGLRYDRAGAVGWKLYTLLRPAVPLPDLDLSSPPTPEALGAAYRPAPSGTAL